MSQLLIDPFRPVKIDMKRNMRVNNQIFSQKASMGHQYTLEKIQQKSTLGNLVNLHKNKMAAKLVAGEARKTS